MPARLRPQPKVPESILTVTSEPTWASKKGIAHTFTVSTRTIDYWRTQGWFPSTKIKGVIRFNVEACERAFIKRFQKLESPPQ